MPLRFSSSFPLLPSLWPTKPPHTTPPPPPTTPPNTKTPHPLTTTNTQLRMTTATPLFTSDKTNTETDTPPTDSKSAVCLQLISCLFTNLFTFFRYHVLLPDGRTQTVTYTVGDGYSGFVADVQYSGEAKYPEHHAPAPAYKPAPVYKPAPSYHA